MSLEALVVLQPVAERPAGQLVVQVVAPAGRRPVGAVGTPPVELWWFIIITSFITRPGWFRGTLGKFTGKRNRRVQSFSLKCLDMFAQLLLKAEGHLALKENQAGPETGRISDDSVS